MADLKKLAQDFFKENPEFKEIHATKEGYLFPKKYDALQHNATFDDGSEVVTFINDNGNVAEGSGAIELNEDQKEILANGLVKENYKSLVEIVKVLKLETADKKADTLIEALEVYKTNLLAENK